MTPVPRFTRWADPAAESLLLGSLNSHEPWALVERFSSLVRHAGSEDERRAADYIAKRLARWQVPVVRHEPHLYVSLPQRADLRVITPAYARSMRCKAPAFAGATGDAAVEGSLAYLPGAPGPEAHGKVVLTPGFPDAARLETLAGAGALAVLFMQPGERIHEGAVSPLCGAPDLDTAARRPRLPAGSISRPEGLALVESLERGPVTIRLKTYLEQGWVRCPVLVSELRGSEEPDQFVLLHAYLDSWHQGAGANATGCAALLEVARVLAEHRDRLRRSVRIAWWSGQKQGAGAGAAWYADRHALDLRENGLAHLTCHSPGCKGATAYTQVPMHPELEDLGKVAVQDATGRPATGARPGCGSDDAFMNLGLPGCFRTTSHLPAEVVAARGYYGVGGCGGHVAWHTEEDTLAVADPGVLLNDTRVYLLAAFRLANAPVHPLDYRPVVADLLRALREYHEAAAGRSDLEPALAEAEALAADLGLFYGRVEVLAAGDPPLSEAARTNAALRGLARALNPVQFVRDGWHRHDACLAAPPLPDLAPAQALAGTPRGSDAERVLLTHLTRGRNRLVGALRQARALVREG